MKLRNLLHISSGLVLSLTALATVPAHADTIAWTNWLAGTAGNPGSAKGTIASGSGITVSYFGQTDGLLLGYPSWTPTTSYTGGTIGNAPPADNNAVKIEGGQSYTETIVFSSAITNPVLAIWSLGQSGDPTYFDFTASEPFTVEAGGPSTEYGGGSITGSGNTITGIEGNGVIQFNGTFTQLTFTTPNAENYYAFTVGNDIDALPGTPAVPEPETLSLFGLGLAALPFVRRSLARIRS